MRLLAFPAFTAFLVCGQTADMHWTFDAASVKPASPLISGSAEGKALTKKTGRKGGLPSGGPGTEDPGRIHYPYSTLMQLLISAYDVNPYRIAGPDWLKLDNDRFTIDATMPPETTEEQFRVMLQNLLVERFKLAIHRETRELPAYALVVAKNGLKANGSAPVIVKRADGTEINMTKEKPIVESVKARPPAAIERRWTAWQATMEDLAAQLQGELNRPVVDATALKSKYNFTLTFEPLDTGTDGTEALPDIFSAVAQIGLKLETKKEPTTVIVIDHIDKTPIAN
jgi:uncharacterized protein (TIGR03435 family)